MSPDTLILESGLFGEISWYFFENKEYNASIAFLKRGVQLYPEDLNMLMNLAHKYLFNNDYQNAMAIYKPHLKDTISPGLSWEDSMRNDLTYFKEHHYDVNLFDKVFVELKIKKPAGY